MFSSEYVVGNSAHTYVGTPCILDGHVIWMQRRIFCCQIDLFQTELSSIPNFDLGVETRHVSLASVLKRPLRETPLLLIQVSPTHLQPPQTVQNIKYGLPRCLPLWIMVLRSASNPNRSVGSLAGAGSRYNGGGRLAANPRSQSDHRTVCLRSS